MPLYEDVMAAVKTAMQNVPACHDFDHILRVCSNAEKLAAAEKCSPRELEIIRLGALLHDCARQEEIDSGGKLCHAELGAKSAKKILVSLGCSDTELTDAVSKCVLRHRWRGRRNKPVTLAEKIVYDADKLDSIGAIGVARALFFAAGCGARIHNSKEDALSGTEYGKEDTAYREYLVKLVKIPSCMLTESGRAAARERIKFMDNFFEQLNKEIF